MARFLSLLQTAACAAGVSGVAGSAPGLAALELLREKRASESRAPQPKGVPSPRVTRPAARSRALPSVRELQRCLREMPLSS